MRNLKYANGMLLALLLASGLIIIRFNPGNESILKVTPIAFIAMCVIKDFALGKLGYDFNGFGVRKMLIFDTCLLTLSFFYLIFPIT